MLKIKDNVDLKELEKFGYIYDEQLNKYTKLFHYCWFWREIDVYIDNPNFKSREIQAYSSIITEIVKEEWIEKNIQDLIKADLVEKVEDKGE